MATLLPEHAHAPIVVRWAWHAFKGEHAPDLPPVCEPIESHIYYITQQTWDHSEKPPLPPKEYAENLLDELSNRVPDGANDVLSGLRRYLDVLAAPGSDPVRTLCEKVLEASTTAYRAHGATPPADLRLKISAIPLQEPPDHCFFPECNADAEVTSGCWDSCCHGTQRHDQTLSLQLAPAFFDSATLAALPFILFHECVSHVLQGPHGHSRDVPENGSQFAEGWMDRAAWEVFQSVEPETIFPYACGATFYHSGGWRAYQARHTTDVKHRIMDARKRTLGWQAACRILEFFQSELGSIGASDAFLRLSFEWNASDRTLTSRDTAAQLMGSVLRYHRTDRRHDLAQILLPALQDFAAGGNLDDLLTAVAEVQRRFPDS